MRIVSGRHCLIPHSEVCYTHTIVAWEAIPPAPLFEQTLNPNLFLVFHGTELTYLGVVNRSIPSGQEAFSNQNMDFYINFVVDLDPGPPWTKFTLRNPKLLQLKVDNITMIRDTVRIPQTDFINSPRIIAEGGH